MTPRIASVVVLGTGLAASAWGVPGDPPVIGVPSYQGPRALSGHLYLKPQTGEAVFTPAAEYLAARERGLRALGDDLDGDGRADYWLAINTDPCALGTPTDPVIDVGLLDMPGMSPPRMGNHHLFKAQFGDPLTGVPVTDVRVESVSLTFFTDMLDTDFDGDTVPDGNTGGTGIEITFWDREDRIGNGSCFCSGTVSHYARQRITTMALANLPGTLNRGVLSGVVLTLDLSDAEVFEIGDADGLGPSSGLYNPRIATDTFINCNSGPCGPGPDGFSDADMDRNGTIDWSYSLRGIQPPDGPEVRIGYQLAAPGIPGVPNAMDPTDGVIDTVDVGGDPWTFLFDYTHVRLDSIVSPMGLAFAWPATVPVGIPTVISRFSVFEAWLGQDPDPAVVTPGPGCGGEPDSDFYGWTEEYPPTGQQVGGLNCAIEDDGDTVPDGRAFNLAYLGLHGAAPDLPCDTDGDGVLTLDDVDAFVAGFAGQTGDGDCNGDGAWTLDDIDCFVACFLAGP